MSKTTVHLVVKPQNHRCAETAAKMKLGKSRRPSCQGRGRRGRGPRETRILTPRSVASILRLTQPVRLSHSRSLHSSKRRNQLFSNKFLDALFAQVEGKFGSGRFGSVRCCRSPPPASETGTQRLTNTLALFFSSLLAFRVCQFQSENDGNPSVDCFA